jgi:hypothetical protein
MRRRLAPFALVVSALAAAPALAGEAPVRMPWDGFGVGSFVHARTTTTSSVEGVPPQTSETKQTLVKITDEAYTIQFETKVGEEWMGTEMPWPRKATGAVAAVEPPKPEELGDEDVTVDGKAYACKKTRIVAQGMTSTTWIHATEGMLKSETKGPGTESSVVVTKLAAKVKVAGKELEVREQVTVTKGPGTASTTTDWLSKVVPGGLVRSEAVSELGGMKTTTLTEAIAYEVK